MYQLFDLEGRNFKIQGYHYPCENAEKVVVLIHGIGEHAGRYARMAEYFEKEKIAIVSMDLRGHG
ncbi:MAG: alpha/beta hydrolase, partial [Firmicutes bacterium]|nr:alpha/beta hydrolase [Bacillota bacterium]